MDSEYFINSSNYVATIAYCTVQCSARKQLLEYIDALSTIHCTDPSRSLKATALFHATPLWQKTQQQAAGQPSKATR